MFSIVVNVVCILILISAIYIFNNYIKGNDLFQQQKNHTLNQLKIQYNKQVERLIAIKQQRNRLKQRYIELKENMKRSIRLLDSIQDHIVKKCKKKMKENSINLQTDLKKDILRILENYLLQKLKCDPRILQLYENVNLDKLF